MLKVAIIFIKHFYNIDQQKKNTPKFSNSQVSAATFI